MRIKSFYANTVEEAMAAARGELGPDAMLVNSRKSAPDARHLGVYEVVFVAEMPAEERDGQDIPVFAPAQKAATADRLAQQMTELKRELEGMRRTINRSALAPSPGHDVSEDGSDAYARLTASDVAPELAREIVKAAEGRTGKPLPLRARTVSLSPVGFRDALLAELESRFQVQPLLGRSEAHPRVIALVGPPGSGKTTTLVKLAVNYGLAARRPVVLLSIDNYRVAAAEQLRSYAAILGVGFQAVETVQGLAQAIEEHRSKEFIFIDTPGLGLSEMADYGRLAEFLTTRGDIDTHLIVSCSMKSVDLSRVVDGYEMFRPQRLIFSKLDETGSFGAILNETARTGKPLSFFTGGQRIPEDLEAASKPRLVDMILGGASSLAASAA